MIIVVLLVVLVLLLAVLIKMKREQKAEENLQRAAEVLFRYRGLASALENDYSWNGDIPHIFLCVSWKDQEKKEFVFDPEKNVYVGYDPRANHITVLDTAVSARHCTLFPYGQRIYVRDEQSTNGTFIKRGMRRLRVNNVAEIADNDTLCVGNTELKLRIRTFKPRY